MFWLKENRGVLTHIWWAAFTTSIDFSMGAQEAACVAMRPWSTGAVGKVPACPFIPYHPSHRLHQNLQEPFPSFFGKKAKGELFTWSILCSIFPSAILSLQSNWNSLPTQMMDNSVTSVKVPGHPCSFCRLPGIPSPRDPVWNLKYGRKIHRWKMCLKYWFHKSLSSQQIADPIMWGNRGNALHGIFHSCFQHRI